MASPPQNSSLTARQRVGLALILLLAISTLGITLYRSYEADSCQTDKADEVVIRELQAIAPIHTGDESAIDMNEGASDSVYMRVTTTHGRHTGNRQKTQSAVRQDSRRDITAETVSPQ